MVIGGRKNFRRMRRRRANHISRWEEEWLTGGRTPGQKQKSKLGNKKWEREWKKLLQWSETVKKEEKGDTSAAKSQEGDQGAG